MAGGLTGNMNFGDNPGDLQDWAAGTGAENGIDPAGPTMGQLSAKPPWLDNFTLYTRDRSTRIRVGLLSVKILTTLLG